MLILLIMESPAGDFTYIILFSLYDKPANGFINPIFQMTWFGLWELIAFVHGQSYSSVLLLNLVPRLCDSRAMPHRMTRTLGSVVSCLGSESVRPHLCCWNSTFVTWLWVFILFLLFTTVIQSLKKTVTENKKISLKRKWVCISSCVCVKVQM